MLKKLKTLLKSNNRNQLYDKLISTVSPYTDSLPHKNISGVSALRFESL